MMRAAMYDRYGPPEVLYIGRLPIPEIGPHQVLVRVQASSANGGEMALRAGRLRLATGRRFPKQVGADVVGEVVERGAGVTTAEVGDRVWGMVEETVLGAAAEYAAVDADRLALAPANLDAAEAVSLVVGGTTAITALRDKAHLRPGERLLVRGASGGVGSPAVQVGKLLGAHVTGLAGAHAAGFVRSLGADVVRDHRRTSPGELGEFDVVLDTVGTDHGAFRQLIAPGGRMVTVALDFDRLVLSTAYLAASMVHGRQRVRFFRGDPRSALLAELTRHAEHGDLTPVVDTVRPLAEIADAHRALEAGGVHGKHVVSIG